jgi:hypothetical protein
MDRRKIILGLRKKRFTYTEIGKKLGITRQRVHQISVGYKHPTAHILAEKLKIWTKRKREKFPEEFKLFLADKENSRRNPANHKIMTSGRRKLLGLPSGKVNIKGGRDFTRELVRMRDNHTCQRCGKKWKKGQRRFDVHHLDEKIIGKVNTLNIPIKYDRENMDKLITFCHKCHFDWHGEYNKSNLTPNNPSVRIR